MKKIIYILIFLILVSNLSYAGEIPYKNLALKLYNTIYDEHTTNCLFRARMYHNYLISKGVRARLVIGYSGKSTFYRHAWNEIKIKDKWYVINLVDLPRTWGIWDINYYNKLKLRPQKYYYNIFMEE